MDKIKKVFLSFSLFLTGLVTKVLAIDFSDMEEKYGVFDPGTYQTKYGIMETGDVELPQRTISVGKRLLSVGKIAIPVILFFIGLIVVLNKKITKKIKIIVCSILAVLAVGLYFLMNFLAKR